MLSPRRRRASASSARRQRRQSLQILHLENHLRGHLSSRRQAAGQFYRDLIFPALVLCAFLRFFLLFLFKFGGNVCVCAAGNFDQWPVSWADDRLRNQ